MKAYEPYQKNVRTFTTYLRLDGASAELIELLFKFGVPDVLRNVADPQAHLFG